MPLFFTPALVEHSELFLAGARTTLLLFALGLVAALALGVFMASLRVWGGNVLSSLAGAYVEFFRNTPLLVQLFFFAVLFAPANLGVTRDPVVVGIIGLAIYTGAYVTEVVRSGILSVDARQIEAARSLGLSQIQSLRLVVLPQAVRTVIPPLGNVAIALAKNTTIVSAISANELLKVAGIIETRNATIEGFVAALFVLWALTLSMAFILSRLERRLVFAR